jgi:hypothetical protein
MWQFGLVLRVTVLILSKGKGKGYPLQTSLFPNPTTASAQLTSK